MIPLTRWVMHSSTWEQQQKKLCLRKMSTSSQEGNLVVMHHMIATDGQIDSLLKSNYLYTRVTDQAKIYKGLKEIQNLTGSHWSSWCTGVTWLNFNRRKGNKPSCSVLDSLKQRIYVQRRRLLTTQYLRFCHSLDLMSKTFNLHLCQYLLFYFLCGILWSLLL